MSLFPAIDALMLKFNQNHDDQGRFAVGTGGAEGIHNPSTADLARLLSVRPNAEVRVIVQGDKIAAADAFSTLHDALAAAAGIDPAAMQKFTLVVGQAVRPGDAYWQIGAHPVEVFDHAFQLPTTLPPALARLVRPIGALKWAEDTERDDKGEWSGSGGSAAPLRSEVVPMRNSFGADIALHVNPSQRDLVGMLAQAKKATGDASLRVVVHGPNAVVAQGYGVMHPEMEEALVKAEHPMMAGRKLTSDQDLYSGRYFLAEDKGDDVGDHVYKVGRFRVVVFTGVYEAIAPNELPEPLVRMLLPHGMKALDGIADRFLAWTEGFIA